jgi:precorrin-6B methylase 2
MRLKPKNRRLKPRLSDLHIKTRLDLGAGTQQIGVEFMLVCTKSMVFCILFKKVK